MNTPVALFIFNRADTTARVLDALRQVQPRTLVVLADGAREDEPSDRARCAAARAQIETIDWKCEVIRDYAETNLGIKRRVESGLETVWAHADEAILLEDDCLPHPTFFRYCEELLARYRDTPVVMGISGTNFHFGQYASPYSYYFSRYALLWGWATWKRAWARYEPKMEEWARVRETDWLETLMEKPVAARYWRNIFERNFETGENWDYTWAFASWRHEGLHVAPHVNLVSNIGFRADASHTLNAHDPLAEVPAQAIEFPLKHPPGIARDADADELTERNVFSGKEFLKPLLRALHARIHANA